MKTYKISRINLGTPNEEVICEVDNQTAYGFTIYRLVMSEQGIRHSPTGFEFGYNGSGPAALAHSILTDYRRSEDDANRFYQDFKREFIATQNTDFKIHEQDIGSWIELKTGQV